MALTKVKGHIIADDLALGGNPTTSTQSTGNNTTRLATTAFVQTELAALVDSSPSSLNTLNELAAALGDDANFSTTVTDSIATKLPLAGGTLTGNILIDNSSSASIGLDRGNDTSGSTIDFKTAGTVKWYMGLRGLSNDNFYLRNEAGSTNALTILTNGNVGIGVASPSSILDIRGSGNVDMMSKIINTQQTSDGRKTEFLFGKDNGANLSGVLKYIYDGTQADRRIDLVHYQTTNGISILDGGNVGIGTTSPSKALDISNTTSAKIHLQGGTNQNGISFAAAGNDGVSSSTYYLGVGSDLMSGTDKGAVLLDVTNDRSVLFDDQSNSRLGFYNNSMIINSSGNVGIGETSPLGKLHIKEGDSGQGTVNSNFDQLVLEDDAHSGITILSGTSSDGGIYFGDSGGNNLGQFKYKHGTNAFEFTTNNGNAAMTIDSSGHVGIGTTSGDVFSRGYAKSLSISSTGISKLQINSATGQYAGIDFGINGTRTADINSSASSLNLNTIGAIPMTFITNGTERMRIAADGLATFTSTRNEWAMRLKSGSNRGGIVFDKPGTGTIMGSMLMLAADESFRLGTASYYHIKMLQNGTTVFGNSGNYSKFDVNGHLQVEHGGEIKFEAAANDFSTIYTSVGYASQSYSTSARYWNHLISKGGTHITVNSDGGHTGSENTFDDFVVWQGSQDTAEPLFRVSNTGRVIAKQNYEIGNHKTNKEEFGVNAINTVDTATSDVNTTVTNTYENRSGVYWLNFNSKRFRAFVRPQWMQGRNWILAAKFFAFNDMPSGSALWTNDASWNGGDFDLNNGQFSKYGNVWRYFGFNRLAMQMGNRVAPIMQFSSTQTLYGAFSGGRAANGGGVTANSTDPSLGTGTEVTYHTMTNYMGPAFTDVGGLEDRLGSYGLNKWAASSTNSTSANNNGSANLNSNTSKGFQFTIEDNHPHIAGNDSIGFAGAWIGCPMDEGNSTQTSNSSNNGADSGFGLGGGCGNTARTWTSGVAEWGRGNEVANYLPAYIWLSID